MTAAANIVSAHETDLDNSKKGNVALFVDHLLAVPQTGTAEEYAQEGVRSFNRSGLEMARAGRCWQRAKEELKHGEFKSFIETQGANYEHVKRAMRIAEFLNRLPPDEARRLARVPHTKILAIAKADPEVVEDLLEEGALDGKHPLSVRDLRTRIEKTEEARHRAEARADTAEATVEFLKRELENRAKSSPTPAWYNIARGEAVALTEAASLSLGELEKLSNEYISGAPHKTDADRTYARMAAATVYHALAGIVANGQVLLRQLVSEFGKDITGEDKVAVCALDGDELKRLVALRAMLVRNNEAERQARQVLRASEGPRKRGRPKGSKNKRKRS